MEKWIKCLPKIGLPYSVSRSIVLFTPLSLLSLLLYCAGLMLAQPYNKWTEESVGESVNVVWLLLFPSSVLCKTLQKSYTFLFHLLFKRHVLFLIVYVPACIYTTFVWAAIKIKGGYWILWAGATESGKDPNYGILKGQLVLITTIPSLQLLPVPLLIETYTIRAMTLWISIIICNLKINLFNPYKNPKNCFIFKWENWVLERIGKFFISKHNYYCN